MGLGDEEIADLQAVSDNLRCSICMEVFLDPVFSCGKPCQHVFCRSCIETALQNRAQCPTCRGTMRRSNLRPHEAMSSFLDELHVKCGHGCGWTGRRDARRAHADTCPVALLKQGASEKEAAARLIEERDQEIAAKRARIQELEQGMAHSDSLAMFRGELLADCGEKLANLQLILADRDADVRRWKALADGRLQQITAAQTTAAQGKGHGQIKGKGQGRAGSGHGPELGQQQQQQQRQHRPSDSSMGEPSLFTSDMRDEREDGLDVSMGEPLQCTSEAINDSWSCGASQSPEGYVQIFVRMLSGKTLVLRIQRSSTVSHIKTEICSHTWVSAYCFYLSASGRRLDEDRRASDYGISRDSTITMVARCSFRTDPVQMVAGNS